MPKLVTLEGIGSVAEKTVQPTAPRLAPQDVVMQVADAVADFGYLLDIAADPGTPADYRARSWGFTPDKCREIGGPTGVGVFTDRSGNTWVLYTRRTAAGEAMHKSLENTDSRRAWTYVHDDFRDDTEYQAKGLRTILQKNIAQIEANHRNKLVVIELARYVPTNWLDIFSQVIGFAAVVGNIALPGLSAYIGKAAQTIIKVANGNINVQELASVATLIAPDNVRPYIDKGVSIYTKIDSGNYLGAAQECGIDTPQLMQYFRKTTDWTQIAKITTGGFDETLSKLQNILNMDAVNVLRGMGISGELEMKIKSLGSITKIKEYQDAVLAGIAPDTLLTMIPNFASSVNAIINNTPDLQYPSEFKTFLGAACGIPFGKNALDDISIKSISNRVVDVLSDKIGKGADDLKQFALSPTVPPLKREYFATEVSKNTGAQILTTTGSSGISSNIRKAAPYIAIGGAAAALYFYSRKN